MKRIILIAAAIIFVIAAISDIVTAPSFGDMSPSEKSFVIRLIVSIGLFIVGVISLQTLKNWIIAGILGLAAFVVLFAGC